VANRDAARVELAGVGEQLTAVTEGAIRAEAGCDR
jgi:hypothetical protein